MRETLSRKRQQKRKIMETFLSNGDVFVFLDPRKAGVVVPLWFRRQSVLTLQFGYNFPVPIFDLMLTDECVSGTLSFNRSPFWCSIPWDAVFAFSDGKEQRISWPDDTPEDLPTEEHVKNGAPKKPKRGHLRLV